MVGLGRRSRERLRVVLLLLVTGRNSDYAGATHDGRAESSRWPPERHPLFAADGRQVAAPNAGLHAQMIEQVLSLNEPGWASAFGGLGLCPRPVHEFFISAAQKVTGNICEIGMGTGVSSALLLMAGASPVYTFDVGSDTKRRIAAYLNRHYDNRLRPHWGNFFESIPTSDVVCDLIFVDALHPADMIMSMDYLAHSHTLYLYHNGGAGEIKVRDFVLSTYLWEELATSDTVRLDGERARYHLGRRISEETSGASGLHCSSEAAARQLPRAGGRKEGGSRDDGLSGRQVSPTGPDVADHSSWPPDDASQQVHETTLKTRAAEIQLRHGFVFLQLFNGDYVAFVRSWICQAVRIPDLMQQVLFVGTDSIAVQALRDDGVANVVSLPYSSSNLSYGQRQYFDYMSFRAKVVLDLLDAGINVWLVEADALWLHNPSPIIREARGLDVIAGQDGTFFISPSQPCAGFIYLNSTNATRRMWSDLMAQHARVLKASTRDELGESGSEMLMLPYHLPKVKWASFERTSFVGGKWYSDANFRNAVNPLVIQNNWLVGNRRKIERAKEFGHWFLGADGRTCGRQRVHHKRLEAELRLPRCAEGKETKFNVTINGWRQGARYALMLRILRGDDTVHRIESSCLDTRETMASPPVFQGTIPGLPCGNYTVRLAVFNTVAHQDLAHRILASAMQVLSVESSAEGRDICDVKRVESSALDEAGPGRSSDESLRELNWGGKAWWEIPGRVDEDDLRPTQRHPEDRLMGMRERHTIHRNSTHLSVHLLVLQMVHGPVYRLDVTMLKGGVAVLNLPIRLVKKREVLQSEYQQYVELQLPPDSEGMHDLHIYIYDDFPGLSDDESFLTKRTFTLNFDPPPPHDPRECGSIIQLLPHRAHSDMQRSDTGADPSLSTVEEGGAFGEGEEEVGERRRGREREGGGEGQGEGEGRQTRKRNEATARDLHEIELPGDPEHRKTPSEHERWRSEGRCHEQGGHAAGREEEGDDGGDATDTVFEIVVLTMSRAHSLTQLLESLEESDYDGDQVKLTIKIDFAAEKAERDAVRAVAESFSFSHGPKTVISAGTNQGLRGAWLDAWLPACEECHAVIFEDDIRVSPRWYTWIRGVWSVYRGRHDVAGVSLMRQNLIAELPWKKKEIVNGHEPFLYSLVGTIGFSPHPVQWRAFLSWIRSIDLRSFDVYIPGLVTSEWWSGQDKRHMWSQHFIYFCKQHDLYTLYVNLPEGVTLAAHMRERGEHYPQTEGQDFPLAPSLDLTFPAGLTKYGWNGAPLARKREMCNPEEKTLCPDHPFKYCRGDIHMIFSVGLGRGATFDEIRMASPILTGNDVTHTRALFLADPFLVIQGNTWVVFHEILDNVCQKGEIGYHVSADEGRSWGYGGRALVEDWHLSFPFVVEHEGDFYMTTCATAGTEPPYSLWLYKATHFPRGWNKIVEILHGPMLVGRALDPILHLHDGVWFLLLFDAGLQQERVFLSESLLGPFREHPASKTTSVRHAGRLLTADDGSMYAFHQYAGTHVDAVQILSLSQSEFQYGDTFEILQPRPDLPWASAGMHTFNAQRLQDGSWAAVTDGWWHDDRLQRYKCLEADKDHCPALPGELLGQ